MYAYISDVMTSFGQRFIVAAGEGALEASSEVAAIGKEKRSHKKDEREIRYNASGGWCRREMLTMVVASVRAARDSHSAGKQRLVPFVRIGKATGISNVPKSTLYERLHELAHEIGSYKDFNTFIRDASEPELDFACNEAEISKLKCCDVRTSGVQQYLTFAQEKGLAVFLNCMAIDGSSFSYEIVKEWLHELIIEQWGVNPFEKGRVSRGWFNSFMQRHPFLQTRVGKTLEDVRFIAEASLGSFYASLETRLSGVDPRLIGNSDEAMCSASDKHIKVIGCALSTIARRKGMEGGSPHISIVPIVTAAGELLCALIVEGSSNPNRIPHVPRDYKPGPGQKFHYAASKSGFITLEIFEQFMLTTAADAIDAMRRRENLVGQYFYILLDNLAAHQSLKVFRKLLLRLIIFKFYRPHMSHIGQPLDRGVFHVGKRGLAKELFANHMLAGTAPNIGTRVELIAAGWDKYVTPTVIIKNSFLHAGIYPVSLERAMQAVDGRYRHDNEHAPPELLSRDMVTAEMLWGVDAPIVLAAHQETLQSGGVIITTTTSKNGKTKHSAIVGSPILEIVRDARTAFKTIAGRAIRRRVSNNPVDLGYSDDDNFLTHQLTLAISRVIKRLKWRTEIIPVIRRRIVDDIEDFAYLLSDRRHVNEKRADLVDLLVDREVVFDQYFAEEVLFQEHDEIGDESDDEADGDDDDGDDGENS